MTSLTCRAAASTAAGLILIGTLSACSAQIAFDVSRDQVIGQWVAQEGLTLTLDPDGSFVAEDWPANLMCEEPGAETIHDLDWADTVTISGTWETPEDDRVYSLMFLPDPGDCDLGSWSSDVWVGDLGGLRLKLFLGSVRDPDTASDEQIVWVNKAS